MGICDLTKKFQNDVNNLMLIVQEIIETNEQNKDVTIFMKDLSECYEQVKKTQLQQEDFNNTLKEVLGV